MTLARPPRTASALGALALALALAGCGENGDDDPTIQVSAPPGAAGSSAAADGQTSLPELDVAHIHGLGSDPSDGTVYAGTHDGLYRIPPDGDASRIGDVQDYMGFTTVGPGHFLASGHPGPDQDRPNPVGLLETTDGGETWTTLSLEGRADFHALAASGDVVYGYAGGLLASTDGGKSWETRSATPVASLAAAPGSPETLLATTEQGPARSTDGGRSFTPLPDAPALLLLSWAGSDVLVGADSGGAVYRSDDGGETWQERGELPGPPEALFAEEDGDVLAAVDGKVLRSADGTPQFSPLTA